MNTMPVKVQTTLFYFWGTGALGALFWGTWGTRLGHWGTRLGHLGHSHVAFGALGALVWGTWGTLPGYVGHLGDSSGAL